MHRKSKAIDISRSQCEVLAQGPHQGNPGDRGLGERLGLRGTTEMLGLPTLGPSSFRKQFLGRPGIVPAPGCLQLEAEVPRVWGAKVLSLCS